jgi:hypothetical protein
VSFVVAPRSSIEIGAAGLVSGVPDALMLTSSITAGAAAMSRRSQIRQVGIPELVDLDLSRYNMRSDLLDLWSLRKFLELVETNGEIGTCGLVNQLVTHHVDLLLQIMAPAWWVVSILVGPVGCLCISAMLVIDVLR